MDQLPALGTAIMETAPKTLKIYEPLIVQRATSIRSTTRKTFPYGPHPRQALDVYYPPSGSAANSKKSGASPVLIFLYGGGLVRGGKTLPGGYADGLVHANVGHFFAARFGYTTVIPDYRLISHGARFPSGGQDVALVVEWVRDNLAAAGDGQARDLFIMGNSAGGIHLSTFLFAPACVASRNEVLKDAAAGLRLRGAVLLSVPFHFRDAAPDRAETLKAYFGDRVEEDSAIGLLKASSQDGSFPEGVSFFVLNGTLDPEDEILVPKRDFLDAWNKADSPAMKNALTVEMMEGQNHISPPLSLGTDDPKEEAWGFQVGAWIESIR